MTADDHANNDRFGVDVAISGNHLLSGAYLEDPNRYTSGGSTYVSLIVPGGGGGSGSLVTEPAIPESNVIEQLDERSGSFRPGLRRELCVATPLAAEHVDAALAHSPREPWFRPTPARSLERSSVGHTAESTQVNTETSEWLLRLEALTNLV